MLEYNKSHVIKDSLKHLYSDIEINCNKIPVDMLGCRNMKLEENEI